MLLSRLVRLSLKLWINYWLKKSNQIIYFLNNFRTLQKVQIGVHGIVKSKKNQKKYNAMQPYIEEFCFELFSSPCSYFLFCIWRSKSSHTLHKFKQITI